LAHADRRLACPGLHDGWLLLLVATVEITAEVLRNRMTAFHGYIARVYMAITARGG
jgi:hypothetical protein